MRVCETNRRSVNFTKTPANRHKMKFTGFQEKDDLSMGILAGRIDTP